MNAGDGEPPRFRIGKEARKVKLMLMHFEKVPYRRTQRLFQSKTCVLQRIATPKECVMRLLGVQHRPTLDYLWAKRCTVRIVEATVEMG